MPKFSRRNLLKVAAAGAVATAAVSTAVQHLTAPDAHAEEEDKLFHEVYKGRVIEGRRTNRAALRGTAPRVLIDGVALHVMVNDDGTYTSLINHYQSFDSPREVAMAAVDHLGQAPLLPIDHHHD